MSVIMASPEAPCMATCRGVDPLWRDEGPNVEVSGGL
jgi:hypothetical protein